MACEKEEVPDLDAATDSGDAAFDTLFDSIVIDTDPIDTSTGASCKEQGVPCSIGDVCCGSLVCGDRAGTAVCAPPFGLDP